LTLKIQVQQTKVKQKQLYVDNSGPFLERILTHNV
jgi:hypothetical protein